MIQRIQTLFLLAAVILLAGMLVLPLAEVQSQDGNTYTGFSKGFEDGNGDLAIPTWPLFILVLVTASLLLINVFLYKKRKVQIRICVYAIVLGFGQIGLMYYFWAIVFRRLEVADYLFRLPAVFPALAIILIYLAFRGIRKDEILIRTLDRIR